MKQLKIIFITVITFFLFLTPTLAATNPYGKYQDLYGVTTVRCTWYAWEQAYKYTGVALPGLGNAQNWYANAKKQGYSVGREAKARSIVVWASEDGYGHVGYVVSVDGDTMITNEGGIVTTVNEGIEDGIRRDIQAENLIGFIYLDEPKKPTTVTPSTSTPVETKSNNNTLSSINIDIQEFSFDKSILEYTLEVDYDIDVITIQATTEDKKAIVTGTGQKALSVGENVYVLTVNAEDNSKKEYTIHITRKEKETNENTISVIQNETVDNNQKKDKTIPIIIISVSSLLCITLSIVLIIKKRKTTQN